MYGQNMADGWDATVRSKSHRRTVMVY